MMWLASSAAALLLIFAKASMPDGIAPYTVLLCVFMLANFAVVLCGTLHAQSEALTSAVIIVTNMGVSIFMFTVGPMPGINQHMWAPAPVWNSTFWTVLGLRAGRAGHRLRPALLPRRAPPRLHLQENKMNNTLPEQRLHALDAVRGFALLLGVAFHAAMSFLPGIPPGIWSMVDNSPSQFLSDAGFVTHIFRMSLFFFIAGFFGRLLYHKLGARGFWANRGMRIAVPLVAGWVVLFPLIIVLVWIGGHDQGDRRRAAGQPEMPEMPPASFRSRTCGSCTSCCCCTWRSLRCAPWCVRLDAAQKLRALRRSLVSGSIRTRIGGVHARHSAGRRTDVAAILVLLAGHPDA